MTIPGKIPGADVLRAWSTSAESSGTVKIRRKPSQSPSPELAAAWTEAQWLNSLHAQNRVTIRRIYPRRNSFHRPRIGTKPISEKCFSKLAGELQPESRRRTGLGKPTQARQPLNQWHHS
jgi:hypothetical protein